MVHVKNIYIYKNKKKPENLTYIVLNTILASHVCVGVCAVFCASVEETEMWLVRN